MARFWLSLIHLIVLVPSDNVMGMYDDTINDGNSTSVNGLDFQMQNETKTASEIDHKVENFVESKDFQKR